MICQKELKRGLHTVLLYACTRCNHQDTLDCNADVDPASDEEIVSSKDLTINERAVWGIVTIGAGYDPLQEFMGVLGIPIMCKKTYLKIEKKLGEVSAMYNSY